MNIYTRTDRILLPDGAQAAPRDPALATPY
jgi:hypothetical protein